MSIGNPYFGKTTKEAFSGERNVERLNELHKTDYVPTKRRIHNIRYLQKELLKNIKR